MLSLLHPAVNETLPLSRQDQDLDTKVSRPRP